MRIQSRGIAGGLILVSASGVQFVRIIQPMVMPGITFHMIMRARAPTVGARMGCWVFVMIVEYAKVDPLDFIIRITVTNHGPEAAPLHLLPTLWFRNTWVWGYDDRKPMLNAVTNQPVQPGTEQDARIIHAQHYALGDY